MQAFLADGSIPFYVLSYLRMCLMLRVMGIIPLILLLSLQTRTSSADIQQPDQNVPNPRSQTTHAPFKGTLNFLLMWPSQSLSA